MYFVCNDTLSIYARAYTQQIPFTAQKGDKRIGQKQRLDPKGDDVKTPLGTARGSGEEKILAFLFHHHRTVPPTQARRVQWEVPLERKRRQEAVSRLLGLPTLQSGQGTDVGVQDWAKCHRHQRINITTLLKEEFFVAMNRVLGLQRNNGNLAFSQQDGPLGL